MKHMRLVLDDQDFSRTGFSIHKAHEGFLVTCGSIFNGYLAWFLNYLSLFVLFP